MPGVDEAAARAIERLCFGRDSQPVYPARPAAPVERVRMGRESEWPPADAKTRAAVECSDRNVAVEQEFVVKNREGLHFRPIMQLVDVAQRFNASVFVHCEDRMADGRSPMELLMLVATHGARLRVVLEGDDADGLLEAWRALFESGFGES